MDYQQFLLSKQLSDYPTGFPVELDCLNSHLMSFQKVQVRWALVRGRAALFNATGLGKTIMQLEWANQVSTHLGRVPVLILAPLAVAEQTKAEGDKFGIPCRVISSKSDVKNGINILNYEKLHKIDCSLFGVMESPWEDGRVLVCGHWERGVSVAIDGPKVHRCGIEGGLLQGDDAVSEACVFF